MIFCWMNKNDGGFNSRISNRVVIFHFSIYILVVHACAFIIYPITFTMVSNSVKDSFVAFYKIMSSRNKALQRYLSIFSRSFNETVSVQAGKFVKLFHEDTRLNILKIGNIPPVQISPENISNISWCNDGGSCKILGKVENKLFLLCPEKKLLHFCR